MKEIIQSSLESLLEKYGKKLRAEQGHGTCVLQKGSAVFEEIEMCEGSKALLISFVALES